ncbi:MAG: hsdM, partial [Clostridiales bacterium]|nr:hsdM [Clostridiales bacterium]
MYLDSKNFTQGYIKFTGNHLHYYMRSHGGCKIMSTLVIKRDEKKGKIWSYIRSKWLVETPEETVRQEYLLLLINEYGFSLDQIAEEL